MDRTLPPHLEEVFLHALEDRVFSGASLLVAAPGDILYHRNWGATFRGGKPVSDDTRFDLASLTKALVTAPLYVWAVTTGRLDLDSRISAFFPPGLVPPGKAAVTLRHLLNHCSGLPAYHPFYLELIGTPPPRRKAALLSLILATPLLDAPGRVSCYSDLGFLLLGMILESTFGKSLESLAAEILFEPLEIKSLHYRPFTAPTDPEPLPDIPTAGTVEFAATEQCPWRRRLIVGEVDDENAYCLGGVAGHAGLFGTAFGIFRLLSFLMDVHSGKNASWSPAILREFWKRQDIVPGSTWALGYDTPSASGSSSGVCFSPRSVGHLGFSGTSFWIDLDRGIMVILLTNRIYPTRENEKLKAFRPLVHNLVMEALHATSKR